jgi:hypothetical protein
MLQVKNCNLLCGIHDYLIGCNFLLSCETLKPNKNKRLAIPASLCVMLSLHSKQHRNLKHFCRVTKVFEAVKKLAEQ